MKIKINKNKLHNQCHSNDDLRSFGLYKHDLNVSFIWCNLSKTNWKLQTIRTCEIYKKFESCVIHHSCVIEKTFNYLISYILKSSVWEDYYHVKDQCELQLLTSWIKKPNVFFLKRYPIMKLYFPFHILII
jgi:hypothetical protein